LIPPQTYRKLFLFPKFPQDIFFPFYSGIMGPWGGRDLPEHKGEKQGRCLKIILVEVMYFAAERQINPDGRAAGA